MPRFVILRHEPPPTSARPLHWDLMFESGDGLRTWALAAEPRVGQKCDAEALPDHRLHYLEYEGAIAGNRGHVTRWDAGTYALEESSQDLWLARLMGHRLAVHVRLVSQAGRPALWNAEFVADPA